MNIKQLFINSAGRLRSGWRLFVFVLLFFFIFFLLGSVVWLVLALAPHRNLLGPRIGEYVQNLIFRLLLLIAALGAGYACTRLLEGLPWKALGLTLHAGWARDFLLGSAVGVASLAVAAAIATAAGGLRFTISGRAVLLPMVGTLVFSAILFVFAGLAEEAMFRGYPLQTMTRANLAWLAVFLTSVPFAASHLRNPNVAAGFTFINTTLAGIWLAVAYLRTRSLWFPLGVHWAWNWTLGSLCGLPVSGITNLAPQPLLRGTDLGPAWLTGGTYGLEGGLAGTIALIVSIVFILRTGLLKATPEMKILTSQENPTRMGEQGKVEEVKGDGNGSLPW
jgi:membrane protease YdiL (CAAX protease family)